MIGKNNILILETDVVLWTKNELLTVFLPYIVDYYDDAKGVKY